MKDGVICTLSALTSAPSLTINCKKNSYTGCKCGQAGSTSNYY